MFEKIEINDKYFLIFKNFFINQIDNINLSTTNILKIKINNKNFEIFIPQNVQDIFITDKIEFEKGNEGLLILIKKGNKNVINQKK